MDGVSREALKDFVHAVEHHRQLRREAGACSDDAELIQLARSYGFLLTTRDLDCDSQDSRISSWFDRSHITSTFRST